MTEPHAPGAPRTEPQHAETQHAESVIRTREFALETDTVYRLLVARTFGQGLRIFLLNGVIVALFVASIAYIALDLSQIATLALLLVLLVVIGAALGYPLWRYRRYVNAPENAAMFAPVRCEIDAQFIIMRRQDGTVARTPLASISRAIVTRSHWLLYVGGLVQHVIPLAAFESPEDSEQLAQRLQRYRVFVQRTRRA